MENRLETIYDAACTLFINKGYVRTQIKDIAQHIGLSTGMIYIYFKGKKEILDFILKCAIDDQYIKSDFTYPITDDLFRNLEDEVIKTLSDNEQEFSSHLQADARDYSFEDMISDCFDTIYRYNRGCLILEKNIDAVGRMGEYYQSYRHDFFKIFMNYLNIFIARKEIRDLENPELTCRLMIETISWWAMHIMNDAFEVKKDIPYETAKKVCMDNLINAYKMN